MSNSLDFKIFHSVSEVDPVSWNQLSAGRPFTSHQWYRYGEAVMDDCKPTYLIAYHQGEAIARATFWRTANEPLDIQSTLLRHSIQALLKRWPLLICRSPLAGISGLILPEAPLYDIVQTALGLKAEQILQDTKCSFLVFDYLSQQESVGWPKRFVASPIADTGTVMELTWPTFDAYLEARNKKDRQHYKKTLREAEKLGIQINRHSRADRTDEAVTLIHSVEQRFGSPQNPWTCAMLERFGILETDATFLTATIGNRLVGCGLVLQDNGAQMNAILGLTNDIHYVYFMLVYESLKIAFDHHIRILRLGSGAYEFKEQLGFSRESNNYGVFLPQNQILRILSRLAE